MDNLVQRFCRSVAASDDTVYLVNLCQRVSSNEREAYEAARSIRKIISKERYSTGEPYNAIMLMSVLCRHGQSPRFTQHIDRKFVATLKDVLRDTSPDSGSCRVLIRDMLAEYQRTITSTGGSGGFRDIENAARRERWINDQAIHALLALLNDPKNWRWHSHGPPTTSPARTYQDPHQSNYVPAPLELRERLAEAESTAAMLEQMVRQSNDRRALVKDSLFQEFYSRCYGAWNSLGGYLQHVGHTSEGRLIYETQQRVRAAIDQADAVRLAH